MRFAELVAPRRFRLAEGAPPHPPGPGEVQVRVTAVGICGSDLHAYGEGGIGGLENAYPMVLGHEPAGVVTAVGVGVTGLAAGDRVACEPAVCCHHCVDCRRGRHNLCRALRFLSQPGEPGFFRELVTLPAENAFALPRGLSDAEGALVEPLAVVLHALALAGPVAGLDVAVFGAGPIGLLTIGALRIAGARRIWAADPLPHRRALAGAVGADVALGAGGEAVRAMAADTGGTGVDVVFDCAAKGETANEALAVARPGGRVVLAGIASEARTAFDTHLWRRKELTLVQVRRSNREAEAARDLLAAHARRFAPMLTHARSLDGIAEAFDICERYADGVGKMTVTL